MLQTPLFIESGLDDALGAAFCAATASELRRNEGITLTPEWLVDRMVERAALAGAFDTVVDAGAGSGRFCIAAARRWPQARIVAVERSTAMLELLRSNLHLKNLTHRVTVVEGDFRSVELLAQGRTLFIGNPPFVRHHDIEPDWKAWYGRGMQALGIRASQLAGLHAHFMLRIVQSMKPGDQLCLVAAAEWLDNGYGSALRSLLTVSTVNVRGLWVAPPDEAVFPDALVSAAVFEARCAEPEGLVELGLLSDRKLVASRRISPSSLAQAVRWTELCQTAPPPSDEGIEVGELFRVVRGQVTGLNDAWILPSAIASAEQTGDDLPLLGLALPAVTRAREIIDGTVESDTAPLRLRRVLNLPHELDTLDPALRAQVDTFLRRAFESGAAAGYVARQRRHWHALDLRPAPAAFVSYMGRRPPVFRTNPHGVTYLNIAHGLYPRASISAPQLQRVLDHLNASTGLYSGRVYGGGLAKFEPSDVARLRIPAQALTEVEPSV